MISLDGEERFLHSFRVEASILPVEWEEYGLGSGKIAEDEIVVIPEEIGADNLIALADKKLGNHADGMRETARHKRQGELLSIETRVLPYHALLPESAQRLVTTAWSIREDLRRPEGAFPEC